MEDYIMRKDRKKYMKPDMEVILVKANSKLLQSSQLPIPVDPEPNPFQW
jgi:hypothetical protein